MKEMIMSRDSLLFLKKQFGHNEYIWNSLSKQMNLFDYLCHAFFMEDK